MDFESKPYWELWEYQSFSGEGAVSKSLRKNKNFDGYAEVEFYTILDVLLSIENKLLWSMPQYRHMTNLEDIGEIRFYNKRKVPIRILGFFHTPMIENIERHQYVMLIGAEEDNKKYNPPNALDTAKERRNDVIKGYNDIVEYNYND